MPGSDALQLIAEGLTDIAGFGVAAIGVVRDDHVEMVAVAGDEGARAELLGTVLPVDNVLEELSVADDWGMFKFVPHDRLQTDVEDWGWVPDYEPLDVPDAWHPLDLLSAPLLDGTGRMRGLLSIDLPVDGRRPGTEQRAMLEKYAAQAARAVLTTLEREDLAEQVRIADAARRVVRQALGQRSLDDILETCSPALVEGFRAVGMWIQTFDEDGLGTGAVHANDGTPVVMPPRLVAIAETAARQLWAAQAVTVITRGADLGPLSQDEADEIFAFVDGLGVTALLFVPLGAGRECLGNLVLTRNESRPPWSSAEAAAALDIGRDLGSAILNVRAFEREHRLVQELRTVDSYKSDLIATVSHELKNPLTAIVGHLEMLQGEDDVPPIALTSLAAMDRGARRLSKVVDDLLLLSKVGDPATPITPRPVDLRRLIEEVVDLQSVSAERRGLTVSVDVPAEPVVVMGDAEELDRVLSNLVSNAIKYTREGGTVRLSVVVRDRQLQVVCADDGIGISQADQERLFTEFFRSTNPEAVAQPGTGLGLAIVRRIVERHGGRIELDSELGRGSTFRVSLPAA